MKESELEGGPGLHPGSAVPAPGRFARIAIACVVVASAAWSAAGSLPAGLLPPPPFPPQNPPTAAKILLGKALFWEEQISTTRTVACGTCHRPAAGGADPRSVFGSARATLAGPDGRVPSPDDGVGSPGIPLHGAGYLYSPEFGMEEQVTPRRAPPVINAAYARELFTDGRAGEALVDPATGDTLISRGAALENQVLMPVVSPVEMSGARDPWREVKERLESVRPLALATRVPRELRDGIVGRRYPDLFRAAFGTPDITPERFAMAIACYERTLISDRAPLDSVLAGLAVLRPDEAEGRELFVTHGCADCHSGPLLTDDRYHYIGVRPADEDSGRARVTLRPGDVGAFRTPSLRNVALRPVYMHGGQIPSLEAAISLYYRGGLHHGPSQSAELKPRHITRQERDRMIAFLSRPLTDPRVALEQPPFDRPSLYGESDLAPWVAHEAPAISGSSGTAPQPVAVEPPLLGIPDFTVAVYNAMGGAAATLVIRERDPGLVMPPAGRADFHRAHVTLRGEGPAGGYGSADLVIPDRATLAGRELVGRWYVDDPGAPGGVAVSPPFHMRVFGPGGKGTPPQTGRRAPPARLHPARYSKEPGLMTLRYDLFGEGAPEITIEDSLGRTLRKLGTGRARGPGSFAVMWDGKDSTGSPVGTGRWFVKLSTAGSDQRMAVRPRWP